jgi:hypothetical protein
VKLLFDEKNGLRFPMGLASVKLLLLGAAPMEDMDMVVIPSDRRVVANPLNPNFAAGVAKGLSG